MEIFEEPENEKDSIFLKPSLNLGQYSYQYPYSAPINTFSMTTTPVDDLNTDLASIRDQVEQLKSEVAGKQELDAINQRLDDMVTSIESARERGQELKAKILLPPSEHLNVQLVPSYSLDRLEEYRSDEKKIFVFLGVFLGGIIGILSQWATQESFTLNRASTVLLVMCILLSIFIAYWAWIISNRVQRVRDQMFFYTSKDIEITKKTNNSSKPINNSDDKS